MIKAQGVNLMTKSKSTLNFDSHLTAYLSAVCCCRLDLSRISDFAVRWGWDRLGTVKTNPCFRQSHRFRYESQTGASVMWLFLNINLSTTMSIKTSSRELSIDIFKNRGICKNNQITLFPWFTFKPKTG